MRLVKIGALLAAMATVTACGDTMGQQAVIGAGAGAATAAVLDGNLLAGAAIGAAGTTPYCQSRPGRKC